MHLLFYYYLASSITLYIKYPHVGIASGIILTLITQDHILSSWGAIAGTICGFVAHKMTKKLIDWRVALASIIVAFVAFQQTSIYTTPFIVLLEWFILPKELFRHKTFYSAIVTLLCASLFEDDFKMQLNVLIGMSLVSLIMIVIKKDKKKRKTKATRKYASRKKQ